MKPSVKFDKFLADRKIRAAGFAGETLDSLRRMEAALIELSHDSYGEAVVRVAKEGLASVPLEQREIPAETFDAAAQACRIVGHLEERFGCQYRSEQERKEARQFVEDLILGRVNLS